MSRRRQSRGYYPQRFTLPPMLRLYAKSRTLEFHKYSEYHMRLIDPDFCVIDIWTTGKYYILEDKRDVKMMRGGEKGIVPKDNDQLFGFLDKLFYAADMEGQ